MADSKDFIAGVDSNAKRSPRRIVFITRRTSAQVKAETEDQVQTFPEVLFRAAVAIQVLGPCAGVDFSHFRRTRSKAWPILPTLRIRRKLPGTSSGCRKCCTIFLRSSRACLCPAWW